MKAIFALILAAIFVYIGVNLLPGLNTTVSTITTPTYSSGVAGMMAVVLIVFAAMIISKNVTLNGDVHRITHQIRGKLKQEIVMLIAELNQGLNLGKLWRD